MLIHRIDKIFFFLCRRTDPVPGRFIFFGIHIGPGGTKQPDFRIFFMNRLFEQLISMEEIHLFGFPLLVPDAQHTKPERLRMSAGSAQRPPFCGNIPICKFNQIQGVLYKLLKFHTVRGHLLGGLILAGQAHIHHGNR